MPRNRRSRTTQVNLQNQVQQLVNQVQGLKMASPVNGRRRRRRRRGGRGSSAIGAEAPVAGAIIARPPPPLQRSLRRFGADVMIQEKVELMGEVSVSSTATINSFLLYPAQFTSWLAGVAVNYSKWRWLKLCVIYSPYCPTSTSGRIQMGLIYDTTDTLPTTTSAMSGLTHYVVGPVWGGAEGGAARMAAPFSARPVNAICVDLDTSRSDKMWYPFITSAKYQTEFAVAASTGNNFVPAQVVYATSGGTSTTAVAVGSLYIAYQIALIEPTAASVN